jgi:hypothetical protein
VASATREHRAAASHVEQAHAGANGEPCALWSLPATPPTNVGPLLHRLSSDAPSDIAEASNPLEADNWIRITDSKFGLLHYSEVHKTLYVAQQLRGSIVLDGPTTSPLFMMATRYHGTSFARLSVDTTYPRV